MRIYEIGTGYTSIPAKISAATEIVVEELTKSLMSMGQDVTIIDIADENRASNALPIEDVKIPEWFSSADVQLGIKHKLRRILYSFALAIKLKKKLRFSDDKTVLHFHNQYNLFFFLKMIPLHLRNKCIVAYTIHTGIWSLSWKTIEKTVKKKYFQEIECMKKADLIYALNQETVENAIKQISVDENKFVLINNGVNAAIYHELTDGEKDVARKRYGFEGKKVFLQVGSIYENKGQKRSITRMRRLLEDNPDYMFAYAGGIVSEEYKNEIDEYVNSLGLQSQVRYVGMVSPGKDLNELYNTAEATIFSSDYEAFGLVIIESMAAGVPVLIDESSSLPNRPGNIFYNDTNFEEIVTHEILNENRRKFHAGEARRNVMNNYSWDKIAEDYLRTLCVRMKIDA